METTTKISKRTVTKYDAQFYLEVHRSNLGIPTPPTSTANDDTPHANKRRRLSPPSSDTASIFSKDGAGEQDTPPSSATPETMSLRLIIPQPVLTKEDHRTLAIRRAAAERWRPKLQKPFPQRKEINEAYKLKLMRHYTASTTSTESNYIKPCIDISPRVNKLRERFPRMLTSIDKLRVLAPDFALAVSSTPIQDRKAEDNILQLMENKNITRSEKAQRLAWQSFSATERDRIDRGREAMMESGLVMGDLYKENHGAKNGLPEWRKRHTGKFSKEKQMKKLI
jgi:hypothetical protein